MRKIFLLILIFIITACSTHTDNAYNAVKKYLQDESFINNDEIEILELKVIKVEEVNKCQIDYYNNIQSLKSGINGINNLLKPRQHSNNYYPIGNDTKNHLIETNQSYQKQLDSLLKAKPGINNIFKVSYHIKAKRKVTGNILEDNFQYFNKDWTVIKKD